MKRTLSNLAILAGSLLVGFVIAEIVCRQFLSPPQRVIAEIKHKEHPHGAEKEQLSISVHPNHGGLYRDTDAGRRLNANRIVTIERHGTSGQRVLIETNRIGYRNGEIAEKGGRRFLFLGDSITLAGYLNEEDTFVRRVETKAGADGKRWETINAGVGGISLRNELAILLETGLSLDPDVVVLNFYLNDFQWSRGVHVLRLPPWMENSWFLYYTSQLFSRVRGTLEDDRKARIKNVQLPDWQAEFEDRVAIEDGPFHQNEAAFHGLVVEHFRDFGSAWSDGAWEYMQPLFEELNNLSEQHDFQLMIVVFPVYHQVYTEFVSDYPQQRIRGIGEDMNIPVLDLLPYLRDAALQLRGPEMYHASEMFHDLFYDLCHHTAEGSEVVATEIYRFLTENTVD